MPTPSHFRIALVIIFGVFAIVQKAQSRQTAISSATGVLSTNQDTVFGVYAENSILQSAIWLPKETILVHNNSVNEIVLDSFSLRPDSGLHSGRLYFDFSSKQPKTGLLESYRFLNFSNGQTNALPLPIRIPAHDSILLGQFGMDEIGVIEKTSATSGRYSAGDSIFSPIAFFSKKDSVKFQLRAKVMGGVLYHPVSIKGGVKSTRIELKGTGYLTNGRFKKGNFSQGPQFNRSEP